MTNDPVSPSGPRNLFMTSRLMMVHCQAVNLRCESVGPLLLNAQTLEELSYTVTLTACSAVVHWASARCSEGSTDAFLKVH